MDDSPNFTGLFNKNDLERLADEAQLPRELLSEVSLATFNIRSHDRAVVFYHGFWSGPSVVALRELCSNMAETANKFPILLVNADSVEAMNDEQIARLKELFGEQIGAWGETCWIKQGTIVARDILGHKSTEMKTERAKPSFLSLLRFGKKEHARECIPQPQISTAKLIRQRIEQVNS